MIPIDPKLPADFDCTPHDDRPAAHLKWWDRPYIQTQAYIGPDDETLRAQWMEAWPQGVRFDVMCLDGGAWDRPTCWGSFATLDEALLCAGDDL